MCRVSPARGGNVRRTKGARRISSPSLFEVDGGATNRLQDGVDVFDHIGVPKPQHLVAVLRQPLCASLVPGMICIVLGSVDLDCEPDLWTCEIDDKRRYGMLSSESEACEPASAQMGPKDALRVGEMFAQFPCALSMNAVLVGHRGMLRCTCGLVEAFWQRQRLLGARPLCPSDISPASGGNPSPSLASLGIINILVLKEID